MLPRQQSKQASKLVTKFVDDLATNVARKIVHSISDFFVLTTLVGGMLAKERRGAVVCSGAWRSCEHEEESRVYLQGHQALDEKPMIPLTFAQASLHSITQSNPSLVSWP